MKILFTILIWVFLSVQAKSDSWRDPDWNEMIDSSDAIALIEYINDGDFLAQAKVLKLYRGQLNSDTIWISGFSNRYGPIDKMSPGDKYIVFLNFNSPTENSIEYWSKLIIEKPEYSDYFEDMKKGKAYYVPSPTSGDLRVKDSQVQYDLNRTTYYREQPFYPIEEFENLLYAESEKDRKDFHSQTIRKIKYNTANRSQHLMMLYLTHFDSFDSIFNQIVDENNPEECYALARLLGQVKEEKALEVLVKLLDNQNSIVQGEAVRQLSKQDPEFIGPILLSRLSTAGEGGVYPANIMDPVMNEIDGGKIEIIKTLGNIKYKPAVKELLPLLETENEHLFKLVVDVLDSLGNRDYIPYLNNHLELRTKPLIHEICRIIVNNDLKECKAALMEFISNHDRNQGTDFDFKHTISEWSGLAHFKDQETIDFLVSDFEKFFTYKDKLLNYDQVGWYTNYIEAFTLLKARNARPLIYKAIYDWHGINEDFGKFPELYKIKKKFEDSLRQEFEHKLKSKGYILNYVLAIIKNTKEIISNKQPESDLLIEITIPSLDNAEIYKDEVSRLLSIPKENIYVRFENGWYYNESIFRVDEHFESTPLFEFLKYAVAVPNRNDITFLEGVLKSGIFTEDYVNKEFKKTIDKLEEQLK